jgi:hypothetical protein
MPANLRPPAGALRRLIRCAEPPAPQEHALSSGVAISKEDENGARRTKMVRYNGLSTEDQARITDIQDSLIELYVDRRNALAAGMSFRARQIEQKIDDLLAEKEEIEESVTLS